MRIKVLLRDGQGWQMAQIEAMRLGSSRAQKRSVSGWVWGENHTANDDRRINRRETREQPGLYDRNQFFWCV